MDVVTGGELADGHAEGGVVADDAETAGLCGLPGILRETGAAGGAAGGGEGGEGEGAVRVLPLTAASRRSLIDPVGDVEVADVNLEQARAQVVGACKAPYVGFGGFPGSGPDADGQRRRERSVVRCHHRCAGVVPAVSDAMSTPMESRAVRAEAVFQGGDQPGPVLAARERAGADHAEAPGDLLAAATFGLLPEKNNSILFFMILLVSREWNRHQHRTVRINGPGVSFLREVRAPVKISTRLGPDCPDTQPQWIWPGFGRDGEMPRYCVLAL